MHLANRLPELLTGKLDLVILTHPEPDHYGGLSAVLNSVDALRLLEPQLPGTSSEYDALLGTVGARGIEVTSPAPPANGDPLKLPLGGGAELTLDQARSEAYAVAVPEGCYADPSMRVFLFEASELTVR